MHDDTEHFYFLGRITLVAFCVTALIWITSPETMPTWSQVIEIGTFTFTNIDN